MISHMMKNINGKGIIKYTMMPEVAPRIREFMTAGFGNLALFMAMVYQAVRLLPKNHAYLRAEMVGKYSIRDVLSAASENLKFDLKHIDQIIIYFALIAGVLILGVQFILLLSAILVNPAAANDMPAGYGEFFSTASPSEDIALRLLDSVFGVPDIFGTVELTETPFHQALHGLFQFYSTGLLIIAAMLIVYFIFVVVAETAQTGTPFGKRYNHAWVPIRIIVAIGLLVPVSYGLNSGQWITLYAAKMGSGFATNGWSKFNTILDEEYALPDRLIAAPNAPSMSDLSSFMMTAMACKYSYFNWNTQDGSQGPAIRDIRAYVLDPDDLNPPMDVLSSSASTSTAPASNGRSFIQALKHTQARDVTIVFGEYNPAKYKDHKNGVFPFCGRLTITTSETPKIGENGQYQLSPTGVLNGRYYSLVTRMWEGDPNYGQKLDESARNIIIKRLTHANGTYTIPANLKQTVNQQSEEHIRDGLEIAIAQTIADMDNVVKLEYGWGGAGIWYNEIANYNGRIVNALMSKPQIKTFPHVMQHTCRENKQNNENTSPEDCFNPVLSQGNPVKFPQDLDQKRASALNDVYTYWRQDREGSTGNIFIDSINALLGTQGLFDMCNNADVHPLAQLSSLGKSMIESAIYNLGIGMGAGIGSLIPYIGPALGAASSFFITVASIGILLGFMLYYLLPFMPFLYFIFAVGGWVKGIFEAMVGIPLWALSHIRIDGQGLPGDGAVNGYFLIFEIFLRPILIVFGLIASALIFGAMIKVLNEIFSLVVSNLSGSDPSLGATCGGGNPTERQQDMALSMVDTVRGPIDEFFYTIVYAILVYMIGMASFKLIDLIPNNILRWMGQGIETFNDKAGEPAEGLMSKMAIGGSILGGQLQGAASSGAGIAAAFKSK